MLHGLVLLLLLVASGKPRQAGIKEARRPKEEFLQLIVQLLVVGTALLTATGARMAFVG